MVVIAIIVSLAGLVISRMGSTLDDAHDVATRTTMNAIKEAFVGSGSTPGYVADMKYVPGFKMVDVQVGHLLAQVLVGPRSQQGFDAIAQRGWRGPYLQNAAGVRTANPNHNGTFPAGTDSGSGGTFIERQFFTDATHSPYGVTGDPAVADSWGNPIVLQVPPASSDAERFRYARIVSAGPDGVLNAPLNDLFAGRAADGSLQNRGDDLVLFLNRSDIYEAEEP